VTYEFLQSLYSDILLMLERIVVKRDDLAYENETAETARAFDLYLSCLNGSRYFYNFKNFDIDILQKYLDPAAVNECYYDSNKIPEEYRESIVEDQSNRVINNFEEKNNYYRMLMGLPNVEDTQWIYLTDTEGIPSDVPVHELSVEQISYLDASGIIDKLKLLYPDAAYLDYLGANSIDHLTARLAKPFDILRLGVPTRASATLVKEMFEREYYCARRYVMANIYDTTLFNNRTLYEPVIGVLMLTLAVRNTLVPDEAAYLNFEEILDAILESYGMLKYFENFPFIFKRRLVMAMDKILTIKGTDKVLVDVCKIFSMDNFIANRYYLMKYQPKTTDGTIPVSGDPTKDYDLKFVKVPIVDDDIGFGTEDVTDYETVTKPDYLWQLSDEEYRKMLADDFNLRMTKYVDVEAAYDVSALNFEVCYFLNMILQSRPYESKIFCTNQYTTAGKSDIYTMIVFLLAGLAKRSGFDGNIVYEAEDIAEIMRFDSGAVGEEIQRIVNSYESLIDVDAGTTLVPGYDSPPALSLPHRAGTTDLEMIEMYVHNRAMYNAIVKEMNSTNDIRRYIALQHARDCLYISHMEHENFRKVDGSYATTYHEMLEELDPKLAEKLDSIDMDENANELDVVLVYALEKLEDLFSSEELKYLFINTSSAYGALIEKYLRMAINVFKASSVQLDSINVIFTLGDDIPIRVIDQLEHHETEALDDTVYVSDELAFHRSIAIDDVVRVETKAYNNIQ